MNEIIKFVTGLYKSPYDERDYLVAPFLADIDLDNLPEIEDNTDKQSPVKNQGKKGSCAGHAGVGVKEFMEIIDYSLIKGTYIDLSEQFLYELARRLSGHKEGTTLVAIANVLVEKGVCREKLCPYTDDKKAPFEVTSEMEEDALSFRIQENWARITNVKELKGVIHKYGAVMIGVRVYKNWYRQKDGHIPTSTWRERLRLLGGHAIVLVGYNDKTKEYKFKNSWGTKWGDNGYGYLTYEEMKRILMDAITMIDIDDPEAWALTSVTQVRDLPFTSRMKIRFRGLV